MELEGYDWGVVYGGACLGNGYLGAEEFKSYPHTSEYLMRIMDTVGVERLSDLTGKFVRVVFENPTGASPIKCIGNLIDDKWFDTYAFLTHNDSKMTNLVEEGN